mmetsp:Transcript_4325/g.11865  ORF Transcript_4325/g.11865 Transcript_4325/m.11865 type:complete len:200 (+) Transcript_4325:712-1311(+)
MNSFFFQISKNAQYLNKEVSCVIGSEFSLVMMKQCRIKRPPPACMLHDYITVIVILQEFYLTQDMNVVSDFVHPRHFSVGVFSISHRQQCLNIVLINMTQILHWDVIVPRPQVAVHNALAQFFDRNEFSGGWRPKDPRTDPSVHNARPQLSPSRRVPQVAKLAHKSITAWTCLFVLVDQMNGRNHVGGHIGHNWHIVLI